MNWNRRGDVSRRAVIGILVAVLVVAGLIGYWTYDPKSWVYDKKSTAQPAPEPALTLAPQGPTGERTLAQAAQKPPVTAQVADVKPKPKPKPKPRAKAKPKPKPQAVAAKPQQLPSVEAHEWKHWGAAPYATSSEEACRKAPEAIQGLSGMPQAVRDHFKQVVGTTCKGGTEAWLAPHERLEQMWSGPDKGHKSAHVMNNVTVAELPVLKSPEGRPYRAGSVAQTAKTLSWSYSYEGKTYVLHDPFACFNWAWKFGPPPAQVVKAPVCATIDFTVEPGDQVWFGSFSRRRLPASPCWEFCDGPVCSAHPTACLNCDWAGLTGYIPSGYQPYHTGHYVAQHAKQRVRYPLEVRDAYVAFCALRKEQGQANGYLIRALDWGNNTHFRVGPEKFPTWDRELIGKQFKTGG